MANQYINLFNVFGAGVEIGVALGLFHGLSEKLSVAGCLGAVTDNVTRRVQPRGAAQRGQGSTEACQCRRLLQPASGGLRLVQQVHGDLRLECHVQTHPVGKLDAVLQAALTLAFLSLMKLLDQLPEQQCKHHQHQRNIPFTEPRKGLVALSIATLDDGRGVEVGKSLFLTAGLKQRCFM
ncbi:hypothetical protein GS393_01431 [Pseudomonas savastanoi pv. phaseolicola]|nr:hypothetical protein [Pseudomonas savastanoi pv. phaseolicola]